LASVDTVKKAADNQDGPLVEDDGSPGGDTAALFRDYGVTQSKDKSDDTAKVIEAVVIAAGHVKQ